MLSIGLMSGTSMDGIDAALLETDGTTKLINDIGHIAIPYTPEFKILLKVCELAIRTHHGDLEKAKQHLMQAHKQYLQDELNIAPENTNKEDQPLSLDNIIAHSTFLHGQAVQKLLAQTGYDSSQIDVVGYHGQAMYHQPAKNISIIVGDGKALAEQVGITVVNDFRSRDIAAGGTGAPFAPLFHQALAIRDNTSCVVVNCGGIANLTIIANDNPLDLVAFDTGPGNALIDRLVTQRTRGRERMDVDGHYGADGHVDQNILHALYQRAIIKHGENYFDLAPPKALDIGDIHFVDELDALSIEDACATLAAFTADSIVRSLDLIDGDTPSRWILAGGGWNNPVILSELKARLGDAAQVLSADDAGWNGQALEAQTFAYLAVRSLKGLPLSFPCTTGVPEPLCGGAVNKP